MWQGVSFLLNTVFLGGVPLVINENEFFRGATLRICGDLAVERAMSACVRYISEAIPVDRLFLQVYEADLAAMRTLAMATSDKGEEVSLLTPLGEDSRRMIRQALAAPEPLGTVTITSEAENPVAREMLRFHGFEGSSILMMRLGTEDDDRHGAVVLTAEGEGCYSADHVRLLGLLFEPFTIALVNTLVHREVLRLRDRLADDNRYLQRELLRSLGDEIVGVDFGLREVMHRVGHVAPTESPVLLTGETGAGKDVIASAIHLGSPRREGPFIPVNCGAIPDSLLDSELFGHEKGAFTGALAKKRGRFERANRGTILLDEIGEMPLQAQVRLLRVLQHREIERVGGTDRIPVDIRIIAATNKDLAAMVREGRFREDLWFRLNVFPIEVPPLRDRRSDIPALVQHFIERKAAELKIGETPKLAPGAIDDLCTYDWPGNVRELENVVERAMILRHPGETLRFDDLETRVAARLHDRAGRASESLELDEVIGAHIRHVLGMTGGKIHGPGGAGELLGVNPNTLRHRMKKLGIPFRKELAKDSADQ
jgi:transcriptional regulator with GAF, ATPase, and Fis domain